MHDNQSISVLVICHKTRSLIIGYYVHLLLYKVLFLVYTIDDKLDEEISDDIAMIEKKKEKNTKTKSGI